MRWRATDLEGMSILAVTNPVGYIRVALRLVMTALMAYWLAKTAIKPDQFEKLRWYDRLIRAIGAIMFLALLVGGLWFLP